ncbi:MAG TPA: hypothetical protein VG938_04945 [Verrucomicrobiae bacterium]|jgi:hypothetical protein|nr:hypothetical protein [Verrucomicrobiae bacterium]
MNTNQKSISPRAVLASILIFADLIWQIFREIKSGGLDWVGLVITFVLLVLVCSLIRPDKTEK